MKQALVYSKKLFWGRSSMPFSGYFPGSAALGTCFLAMGAILGASGDAHATDDKVYPASGCVRFTGGSVGLFYGAILNKGTSTSNVDCPLIHDVFGNGIKQGYVRYIDRHPTQNVVCTLNSVHFTDNVQSVVKSGPETSSGTTNAAGSDNILDFQGFGTAAYAHYYYSCSIPPVYGGKSSGIINYGLVEADGGN